jgi:hypothetical protein
MGNVLILRKLLTIAQIPTAELKYALEKIDVTKIL